MAQLLRRFSTDQLLGRQLSLDSALAHHLHQCSYHLRLFRNWLISGQDTLDCLYGQPCRPAPLATSPTSLLFAPISVGGGHVLPLLDWLCVVLSFCMPACALKIAR